MKKSAFGILVAALVAVTIGVASAQTPNINSAIIKARIFDDCPSSLLTTVDSYPSLISIADADLQCGGFANLHVWRLSENDATEAMFPNNSAFSLEANLTVSGTSEGEAGLQIAPWWSPDVDGRFNCRTTDGEIACFGGRLPFYSFTGTQGVTYVKGTTVRVKVIYRPNGLNMASPATIEYIYDDGTEYTSGELAFDEGNPAEDPPYGLWGMLNEARVGGYVQAFLQAGNPDANLTAEWADMVYEILSPVSVEPASWGTIKANYR